MVNLAKLYGLLGDYYSCLPIRWGQGRALPPLRVALVLTHRCNLRCAMCFVWKHGGGPTGEKSELTTAELMAIMKQSPPYSILTFTGGEPFVRQDIQELLTFACKRRRVHLVTNGTLVDRERLELLGRLSAASVFSKGLLSLGVSLEGPEDVHDRMTGVPGSFRKSLALVSGMAAQKRGKFPLLDVKVVMTRDTFPSLTSLYREATAAGANLVSFQIENTQTSAYGIEEGGTKAHLVTPPPVTPAPRALVLETIEELLRIQKPQTPIRFNPAISAADIANRYENLFVRERFFCDTPWTVMHIGPYGDVFPCYSYPMGSVRRDTLQQIWNNPAYREFRRWVAAEKIFPGCAGCCVMKSRAQ